MPEYDCETCKNWWVNSDGEKVKKRTEEEKPDCSGCPRAYKWLPESLALIRLFNFCFDPASGAFVHLPNSGGVLEQDVRLMNYLEIIRQTLLPLRRKGWPKVLGSVSK
jgi:hypothetical protein